MTRSALLRSWFVEPPLAGKWTLLWIVLALPLATLIRASMNCPDPIGECCTPFFIFVLLTAILLGSWSALGASLASAIVALAIFHHPGHPMSDDPGEFWGLSLFFLYCALIIGAVAFVRRSFARHARIPGRREASSGVIFSLEDGQAWASWPGSASPVRLGPEEEVSAMMKDFLAQAELGRRLTRRTASTAG